MLLPGLLLGFEWSDEEGKDNEEEEDEIFLEFVVLAAVDADFPFDEDDAADTPVFGFVEALANSDDAFFGIASFGTEAFDAEFDDAEEEDGAISGVDDEADEDLD